MQAPLECVEVTIEQQQIWWHDSSRSLLADMNTRTFNEKTSQWINSNWLLDRSFGISSRCNALLVTLLSVDLVDYHYALFMLMFLLSLPFYLFLSLFDTCIYRYNFYRHLRSHAVSISKSTVSNMIYCSYYCVLNKRLFNACWAVTTHAGSIFCIHHHFHSICVHFP